MSDATISVLLDRMVHVWQGLFLDNDLAEGRFKAAGRPLILDDIKLPMFVER